MMDTPTRGVRGGVSDSPSLDPRKSQMGECVRQSSALRIHGEIDLTH